MMMMEDEPRNIVTHPMLGLRENPTHFHLQPRTCRPELPPQPSPTHLNGVVLQQNGKWGAQIYANNQRIWLGTFKSERSAAMSYDRAATKLGSSDPKRNFLSLAAHEPMFQDLHTTESVRRMTREGSYETKLAEFLRSAHDTRSEKAAFGLTDRNGVTFQELFHKELTPSDVGKLNRLVIPKKHAVKYFPRIQTADRERDGGRREEAGDDGTTEGRMMEFMDLQDQAWEFRYCYWKSSQSFVFTKGWNRFVRTKDLRARDVVTFYRCADREGRRAPFFVIDIGRGDGGGDGGDEGDFLGSVAEFAQRDEEGEVVFGGAGGRGVVEFGLSHCSWGRATGGEVEEGQVVMGPVAAGSPEKKGFRLFGVQICERR